MNLTPSPTRLIGRPLALAVACALLALPSTALAGSGGTGPGGGPTGKARLVDGKAVPPADAPSRVVKVIKAANEIAKHKGYCYGGGHSSFRDNCYDCSGAVSYALHGGNFVSSPLPSTGFYHWGKRGKGRWITVHTNSSHAYAVIAGLRWDTSMTAGAGPGWSTQMRSSAGFRDRHPGRY